MSFLITITIFIETFKSGFASDLTFKKLFKSEFVVDPIKLVEYSLQIRSVLSYVPLTWHSMSAIKLGESKSLTTCRKTMIML